MKTDKQYSKVLIWQYLKKRVVSQFVKTTCSICGKQHADLPNIGPIEPFQWSDNLNDSENSFLTGDFCVIENSDYFVRGVIEIPVHDGKNVFGWDVWISLKKENFQKYHDTLGSSEIGPFFGWLCTEISYFPQSTLALKTTVYFQGKGQRPKIKIQKSENPLFLQQETGISLEDAWKIIHYYEEEGNKETQRPYIKARFYKSLKNPRLAGFKWQEPENEQDTKMFRAILTRGCQILQIESSETQPEYCYSIGLYLNLLQPEIIVLGVHPDTGAAFINRIADDAKFGDITTISSVRSDLFDDQRRIRFKPVQEERYFDYLGYGCWFYRSLFFLEPVCVHKFPVLQAIWPDQRGFFPDEEGCDRRVVEVQRLMPQE